MTYKRTIKVRKSYSRTAFHPMRIGLTISVLVSELGFWVNGASLPDKFFSLGISMFICTIILFVEHNKWDYEEIEVNTNE